VDIYAWNLFRDLNINGKVVYNGEYASYEDFEHDPFHNINITEGVVKSSLTMEPITAPTDVSWTVYNPDPNTGQSLGIGAGTTNLGHGNHEVSSINLLNSSSILNITGGTADDPTRIHVTGPIYTARGGKIQVVPDTGPVAVFCDGNVSIKMGLGSINKSDDPSNFQLYCTNSSVNIETKSIASHFCGVIYAPQADFTSNNLFWGSSVKGAIVVGDTVIGTFVSSIDFNYDTNLINLAAPININNAITLRSWHES